MPFPGLGLKHKAGIRWCHESSGRASQRARPGGHAPSSSAPPTYAPLLCSPRAEARGEGLHTAKQGTSEDPKQCSMSYTVWSALLFQILVCLNGSLYQMLVLSSYTSICGMNPNRKHAISPKPTQFKTCNILYGSHFRMLLFVEEWGNRYRAFYFALGIQL